MDKAQALQFFWSGFGLPAYDENTVPDEARVPYITYNTATDSLENMIPLTGSIWYKGTMWQAVEEKAAEIARRIAERGHCVIKLDDGYMWITKGSPFASRVPDASDPDMRRIYINIMVEFLTAY